MDYQFQLTVHQACHRSTPTHLRPRFNNIKFHHVKVLRGYELCYYTLAMLHIKAIHNAGLIHTEVTASNTNLDHLLFDVNHIAF
jgi:hypothetical protein